MAYVISTSEDSATFCLQTAHVADKTISFTVTTRPPSIPVCATFHPFTVISLPCCAYIRNTCPFYPQLTVPTTPVKCNAPTQKQLSSSIRILKHINRIRLTAECVCCAGMLINGKGEEQDQKMAAIKRVTYTFASAKYCSGYSVRWRFECPAEAVKYKSARMRELHNVGIVDR